MKEILEQYSSYNIWANDRIIKAITALPAELIEKSVESSFNSLKENVLHLWQTEYTWWQRLQLAENIVFDEENKKLPINEMCSEWRKQSQQYHDWILKTKEANLTHVTAYNNSKKEQFKQPVYQILLHLFNHNTYHRGQIVTIFHQLKIDKIPNTDFINWSRTR